MLDIQPTNRVTSPVCLCGSVRFLVTSPLGWALTRWHADLDRRPVPPVMPADATAAVVCSCCGHRLGWVV